MDRLPPARHQVAAATDSSSMNDQLIQRIKACPSLPSLPTIAVQVLDLAQKSDVDIPEIARLISKDPALSTKILKTVNSSFYGRSKAVSTISQALIIMGLQSVKTLVLGFSLVSNLSKTKPTGFKHVVYWKRSIYSATAGRVLAAKLGLVHQEEAFLCGLLKDIGMLVLDTVLGEEYGAVYAQASSHADLPTAEREAFGMNHAEVGGMLAEQWKLPPILCTPIAYHHNVEGVQDPNLRRLTQVVAMAGRCANVFVDDSVAEAIHDVRNEFQQQFRLSEAECDQTMADIGKRTKEIAGLFEINIGASTDYGAILKKANDALVELTLRSQMQATQLEQQNVQLKAQASTDALTGLANRATFDQFLQEAFTRAKSGADGPLSLILLDIDKFKSVNDTHGHPVGDAVIRAVARLARAASRKTDLPARYGGEEMAIVLPNTPRANAAQLAETIRRALAAKPIPTTAGALPITASLGVASVEAGSPLTHPAHLVKAADLALYHAKNSGRNNVKVYTPKSPAQAA